MPLASAPGQSRARAAVLLISAVTAIAAGRSPGQPASSETALHYRLSFDDAHQRVMQVDLRVPAVSGPVELVMSRSSPGRYALHEFAINVFDLRVSDGAGRALAIEHPVPHLWVVPEHDGAFQVRYRVYGDRVDGTYLAVDSTHAHINVPATLIWARGLEDRAAIVEIVPPSGSGWRVATQLFPTANPFAFTAPNLAYLADSPIEASRHMLRTFRAPAVPGPGAGPPMALALHADGVGDADAEAHVQGLRRIVSEEAAIFGEYPPFEPGGYTFLADYLPWAVGDGMEHRNSTVLTNSASLDGSPRLLLATAAHEFFHVWNVERIRPRTLEPFDLESANTSGELWLAEGVTTYYEKLVMHRAGLSTLTETIQEWSAVLNQVLGSPARLFRSAEDMSRMAPLVDGARSLDRTNLNYSYLSYYLHGAALGLALDLALREHTRGERSLDDFMRAMWAHHGRPGGSPPGTVAAPYTIHDVRARLAEVAGDGAFAASFLARYVQGREAPDFARLLAPAGLRLQSVVPGRASMGAVPLQRRGSRLRIAAPVAPGTPLYEAGLAEDDEIVSVAGHELTGPDVLAREIERHAPGDRVALRVVARGASTPRTVDVTLVEDGRVEIVALESLGETLTPDQRRFRESWLTTRVPRFSNP
jgi:predicted metalloprotease with PDZ domain